ncbi:unnamed protein product [Gongylonema pulchrum]|uniref:GCP_N_terminal domain-containing protein n=1 Tax=Gongylonema pulchrum TaxID=637853 RepID=A0A183EIA6_9BILA|nr:unnamed protein product [Gongylonema pulchrum]
MATKLALNTYVLESICYYIGGLFDEELVLLADVEEAVIHKCARRLLSEAVSLTARVTGPRALASFSANFGAVLENMLAALLVCNADLDVDSMWRTYDGRFYERLFGGAEKAISFSEPKLTHFIAEHAHPSLKVCLQC